MVDNLFNSKKMKVDSRMPLRTSGEKWEDACVGIAEINIKQDLSIIA